MAKVREYGHGIYTPKHLEKYKGKRHPYYRSNWELKLMILFDNNERVIEWVSEPFPIAYMNPVKGKISRYYPDFLVKYRNDDGSTYYELIELKPYRQTIPPKQSQGKKHSVLLIEAKQWAINVAKWNAAQKYCNERKIKFYVITEKNVKVT